VKNQNPKAERREEIRNPKAEGRKKSEIRTPKSETRSKVSADGTAPYFGFRPSAFFRISDFGLRISVLTLLLLAAYCTFAATTNLPSEEPIPRLRPPRGEIAPTFWEQNGMWIIAVAVVVLGAVAFAVWWLTRPKPALPVPPDVQASKALESLRQEPEDGAVLSQISQLLRHYVVAAFALPPGEMTTADFCRSIAEQGRLGEELSAELGDFLRSCDQRKFAPPSQVAARILPAVEGGILPPGSASESPDAQTTSTPLPPGRMPGSTAGRMPAATAQDGAPTVGAVAQALKLIELAEARRAQLPPAPESTPAPHGPRAYRGAAKD
jgi:hypothetical protein